MQEEGLKPWVREILSKIEVKVRKEDWIGLISDKKRWKKFQSPPGQQKKKYHLIGFEDAIEDWNDHADIMVKIYREPPERDMARVEIFCSGIDPKKIRYNNIEVLDYKGYTDGVATIGQNPKSIIGTVIFDVKML